MLSSPASSEAIGFLQSEGMQAVIRAAFRAVRLASQVAIDVQSKLITADTLAKVDASPVTVADFSAQAIVSSMLKRDFESLTGKPFRLIAEEESATLREGGDALISHVVGTLKSVAVEAGTSFDTAEQVYAALDCGAFNFEAAKESNGGITPSHYFILDPIDGTKGFLRRGQYAVGLSYIVEGIPVLSVMGCPNLPLDPEAEARKGLLFHAQRGCGAWVEPLFVDGAPTRITVSAESDPRNAVFCESFDASHSDHDVNSRLAAALGITRPSARLDSMCKYALVSSGQSTIFLRFPKRGYKEKVWDHAPGVVLLEEAGGRVTDARGRPLDFSQGVFVANSDGVVATNGILHDAVLEHIAKLRLLD